MIAWYLLLLKLCTNLSHFFYEQEVIFYYVSSIIEKVIILFTLECYVVIDNSTVRGQNLRISDRYNVVVVKAMSSGGTYLMLLDFEKYFCRVKSGSGKCNHVSKMRPWKILKIPTNETE